MFNQMLMISALSFICICVAAFFLFNALNKQNSNTKPGQQIKNIILILADDLGWSDVGYAQNDAITPTIDRLAREGIILDQVYTYPMCTPSRTATMTGVFTERTGLQHFVIPNSQNLQPIGLPLNFNIIPQYLKTYGFESHIVGKWHLGSCKMEYTPVQRGFDSFFGYFYGVQNYYTHRTFYLNDSYDDFWNQTKNHLVSIADKINAYNTFAFNNRIREILDYHDKSKPLFIYYTPENPHSDNNFNVPKQYEDKFKHITNEKRRRILGMGNLLDESILNITRDLKRNNMLENTLIFFSSDNGGEISDYQRNYPLRGGKTTVFEGGQRVRAFIYGKHLNIEPFVYDGMFHSVDWLPTILGAALSNPIDIDGIDGVNQWDTILKNRPSKRNSFIYTIDPLGCRRSFKYKCNESSEAIRLGDWKLIRGCPGLYTDWYNVTDYNPDLSLNHLDKGIELSISYEDNITCQHKDRSNPKRYFLFNIKEDPYEKTNLASHLPCYVRDLEQKLEEYKTIAVEPQLKEPLQDYNDPRGNPINTNNQFWPGWC